MSRTYRKAERWMDHYNGDLINLYNDVSLPQFPKIEEYFGENWHRIRELWGVSRIYKAVKVADDFVTNKSMQSILAIHQGPDLNYLLGILNSRLMSWYFLRRSNIAQRDDFPKIILKETRSLPIVPVAGRTKEHRFTQEKISALTEEIIDLYEKLRHCRLPHEKDAVNRQAVGIDMQIDRLVYQLYDISQKEIVLVEKAQDVT